MGDGFPMVFFQQFWNMLEDDLYVFFNEFHSNGVLAKELGASFIALIPRKQCTILLRGFQPISFSGCIYNILAKVLANRLRRVLPKVI